MYYLYVDESGDAGDYMEKSPNTIGGSSKFLTLGGIIVDDNTTLEFEDAYQNIMRNYFGSVISQNFKIHYEEIRNCDRRKKPSIYTSWPRQRRKSLADDFFHFIKNIDCSLLSVSINLKTHCERYTYPVNPTAYALYLLLERFQYFLEDNDDGGEVIYERFKNIKKNVGVVHTQFAKGSSIPKYTSFENIQGQVFDGNPNDLHLLQFADFFVYAPWLKCESNSRYTRRYDEIKSKYYNLDFLPTRKRGNYEI